MMGTTHYRLGALYYILLGAAAGTVPLLAAVPVIGDIAKNGISLAGVLVAALAALMPDMDSQHSKINRLNPVTGLANEAIDMVTRMLGFCIRLALGVGSALLILRYSQWIIVWLKSIKYISEHAEAITYITAAILALSGIFNGHAISAMPVLGSIYRRALESVSKGSSLLKRAVMFLAYAGCGAAILIYNFNYLGDGVVYLAGLLLIATAIFPHRSFLHSTEGLVMYSVCAFYLAGKLGYAYLGNVFFLGYASHLYLADMFTREGIPLSVIPMILKKAGIHKVLKKYAVYRAAYGVLDIRLRLPLSSTGSKSGDRLEGGYVLLLLIACATAFLISGAGIRIAIL